MLNIIFHPDVESEVRASFEWCQNQATDLGEDFLSELETAYKAIVERPNTWPKFQNGFRRFLLSRCPKITSRSCLPCCPSSALQQELHNAAMRLLLRLE